MKKWTDKANAAGKKFGHINSMQTVKRDQAMNKLKIEYKPTIDLIPYARNSRTHSELQVNQIASSIREFGFRVPVLVSGDNTIIAGHGRVLAALKLGIDEIPTVDGSDMTESQRRLYVIADNKIALNAGWDEDILKLELESFGDGELEITGFSGDEINMLMNGWQSNIDVSDDVADPNSTTLKVKIDKEQAEFAKEVVTNALDQAGIEYEL